MQKKKSIPVIYSWILIGVVAYVGFTLLDRQYSVSQLQQVPLSLQVAPILQMRSTSCGEAVIVRDWYRIGAYHLTEQGACAHCGAQVPGRYQKFGKPFGPRRIPVRIAA